MSDIIYKKGSILEAARGWSNGEGRKIIAHACNAQGVWGSGVARVLREAFPGAYATYHQQCVSEEFPWILVGKTIDCDEIAALITSEHYGPKKDPPDRILQNTYTAIADMFWDYSYKLSYKLNVHSPRINAGLFEVPWEQTERIIKQALELYPQCTWTVWDPNLEE